MGFACAIMQTQGGKCIRMGKEAFPRRKTPPNLQEQLPDSENNFTFCVVCSCQKEKEEIAMTTKPAENPVRMLMYGKEASNRKQEIDRQHYTIPNQRPKDKHFEKI